jgi:hypothetical protein
VGAGVESLAQAQHRHGRKERRKIAGRAATVHVLNEVARAAQQKRLHWPRDCNTRDEEKRPNSREDCPLSNRRSGHHGIILLSLNSGAKGAVASRPLQLEKKPFEKKPTWSNFGAHAVVVMTQ